jgi:hypothetical protein
MRMKNQKTYEYDGKTFNTIRELALYSGVNYNKLCSTLRTTELDVDAAINYLLKLVNMPDGRSLNKERYPLYVTPEGREIWTYKSLAAYFHISDEQMYQLRIKQRLNSNQIVDLLTKEKEKVVKREERDIERDASLEKAIRVQITVDLAELVLADIEKRISVKGEISIIAAVDRPYDPKYVCNDYPKLEMEVNDMIIKNLNNRNDGYKYYFASHIVYITEHRWYSVIYFATKVMEDK